MKTLIILLLMTSVCYADFTTENGLPTKEEFHNMNVNQKNEIISKMIAILGNRYREDERIIQDLKKLVQDQDALIDKLDQKLSVCNYETDVLTKKDAK